MPPDNRSRGERALAAPIHLSTTFEREPDGSYPGGYFYSRNDNPNRHALEDALAELEGGVDAAAFASGSAAAMTLFQSLRPGDHAVVAHDSYYSVRRMLDEVFVPWGLAVTYADCTDPGALAAAIRPATRIVFVETPSNPMLRITDLEAAARLAHDAGAQLVARFLADHPAIAEVIHPDLPSHPQHALACCQRTRCISEVIPREVSHDANGEGIAPHNRCRSRMRAHSSSSRAATSAPPIVSWLPAMYFVVEWMTRSAPCSIGRCSTGVASVLSQTSCAPASCASRAAASRSVMRSIGFDGVSTNTMRVAGRIAAASAPGSVQSAYVTASPHGTNTSSSIRRTL